MQDKLVAWVALEILPHEPQLRGWLKGVFSDQDIDDIVQEAYCRIAALQRTDHILHPRRYLFETARNVMLEQIRRTRVVRIDTVSWLSDIEHDLPLDELSPERILAGRRLLRHVEKVVSSLPDRCRRVLWLRKIEGLSQREIARRLNLSETIVENEVSRGIRRILRELPPAERSEVERLSTSRVAAPARRRRD